MRVQIMEKSLEILGVIFSVEDAGKGNWEKVIGKTKLRLLDFKGYTDNLFTKVQILKSYIIPLFLNLAVVFPIPNDLITTVYAIFFNFLWGSRIARVKRGITYHKVMDGGLGMLCPEAFFGSFFIYYNLSVGFCSNPPEWAKLFRKRMDPLGTVWEEGNLAKRIALKIAKYPYYIIRLIKMLHKWEMSKQDIISKNRKDIYEQIVTKEFKEPITFPNCPVTCTSKVIDNLNIKGVPNEIKTVICYSMYDKLLVKTNIKHIKLDDLSCPRDSCSGIIENQHLFLDCQFAQKVWDKIWTQTSLKLPYSYQVLVYGIFPTNISTVREKAIEILLAVVKYNLWKDRCLVSVGREGEMVYSLSQKILFLVGKIAKGESKSISKSDWERKWKWFPFDNG
nr:PREDICTED: uncharacterized protein LOC106702218 [Latimeria chalumnae]|eukprot:XP_014339854.1 PREDICTED: uncharacterized protein LOC106702218 [Latimeria chalumnae]